MRRIFFKAVPYNKNDVTLALESGVDGVIVPDEHAASARSLSRLPVIAAGSETVVHLETKDDERHAAELATAAGVASPENDAPRLVTLARGWEVIPVENLLAASVNFAAECGTFDEAVLAAGILERGVDCLVLTPDALPHIKDIVAACKYSAGQLALTRAVIRRIVPAGMGHRVCVDTTGLLRSGQGMLVGNSAAFTFLVGAETEHNEYVAARPFRINAGAVHAYAVMLGDRTSYLEELAAGSEVLTVSPDGQTGIATVGRVKVERRPMLLVEAEADGPDGPVTGAVFLQNAETIRLVTPSGAPVSVVALKEGDTVLCRLDVAGRHFGMRITEDIREE